MGAVRWSARSPSFSSHLFRRFRGRTREPEVSRETGESAESCLAEVAEEVIDVFRGGVEGGHPADDARRLVPEMEEVAALEGDGDVDGELGEDGVGLDGVDEADVRDVGEAVRSEERRGGGGWRGRGWGGVAE